MPRTMHDPLARRIATSGYRVITLDLLGHGRSDRPADATRYSMTAFAHQVVGLLDHLGVEQAVIGGTSLGANVTLEVAFIEPSRVRGMILEMPVLDNAVETGIIVFAPLIFFGRVTPWAVNLLRGVSNAVPRSVLPFWARVWLDTLAQEPQAMAATVHGIFFGRIAPSSRFRRTLTQPAVVIGHPHDPVHPAADAAMLAEELPEAEFVAAESIVEWRVRPDRITGLVLDFLGQRWPSPRRRSARNGTMGA
jgi:pimeloyl-ACP methyl ester carboxylesterase